jgi:hypothetical protein
VGERRDGGGWRGYEQLTFGREFNRSNLETSVSSCRQPIPLISIWRHRRPNSQSHHNLIAIPLRPHRNLIRPAAEKDDLKGSSTLHRPPKRTPYHSLPIDIHTHLYPKTTSLLNHSPSRQMVSSATPHISITYAAPDRPLRRDDGWHDLQDHEGNRADGRRALHDPVAIVHIPIHLAERCSTKLYWTVDNARSLSSEFFNVTSNAVEVRWMSQSFDRQCTLPSVDWTIARLTSDCGVCENRFDQYILDRPIRG